MTMTHARLTFRLLALGLPALLALAACQTPQATTPAGKGIAVIKTRLGQPGRQVLATPDRPLKAGDIRVLRISLVNQTALEVLEQDIASPGAEVAAAFRNLHAQTNYVVEARAFTTDDPDNGEEVAIATAPLYITNETTPVLANLTLKLANVAYDGQMTATGVDVVDGDYMNTATTSVKVEYDTVTSVTQGGGGYLDGSAASARFGSASGLVEVNGKLYIADQGNAVIRMYDPDTEQVTTAFGDESMPGFLDDPTGTGAEQFANPTEVVTDGDGNLYVADRDNFVIRKIELATGKVTTLVGVVGQDGFQDSPASPTFGRIEAMAYASDALYVADTTNNTIRMVDLNTLDVSTLAGTAGVYSYHDTLGTDPLQSPTAAEFRQPKGIAVRFEGADRIIYVADTDNHVIRKILTSGGYTTVSTLAGVAGDNTWRDGLGSGAGFRLPCGLTFDAADNLIVADYDSAAIRKVTPQGRVTTYVGHGWDNRGWKDGPQRSASIDFVREVWRVGSTLFFYDDGNQMLRKVE